MKRARPSLSNTPGICSRIVKVSGVHAIPLVVRDVAQIVLLHKGHELKAVHIQNVFDQICLVTGQRLADVLCDRDTVGTVGRNQLDLDGRGLRIALHLEAVLLSLVCSPQNTIHNITSLNHSNIEALGSSLDDLPRFVAVALQILLM